MRELELDGNATRMTLTNLHLTRSHERGVLLELVRSI
jgi:hypothetical protein